MNHLLLASILTTGLALGGASGVYAADQYGNSDVSDQQSENYRQDSTPDKYSAESGQYTVKSGDTLASIAEEQLGSQDKWQEIASANNIENPDRIFEGQTLTIPAAEDGSSLAQHEEPAQQEDTAAETSASENKDDMGNMAESNSAQDNKPMNQEQELKGEITEIGTENNSLSLKDEQGMTHSFTKFDDEDMLEGVTVGDFVKVEIEHGTVISLEKVDRPA
ncbi:MAG: LysM peptidoglycan-binding domain-containing protein [Thermodesulfobacteriota bacterium]